MAIDMEKEIPAFHSCYGWITEVLNLTKQRTKYTKNEIRVYESGICEIDVYDSFGMYKDTSIFSVEDLEVIQKHKWYKDNTGYLSTTINNKKVRLHKLLYPNQITDHYDNNKLNNTRSNLNKISHSENVAKITNKCYNPNGVTGIYVTSCNHWQAHIEVNKNKFSKNFATKEEAVLMRYIWELNYWGINAPQLSKITLQYPKLSDAMYKGYKINENTKLVLCILKKLEEDVHCPCAIIKNEDTKCMCKAFRESSEGTCHCGLYVKTKD